MGETLPLLNRSTDPQGDTSDVERSLLYHSVRPVRRVTLGALADTGRMSTDGLATEVAARIEDSSTGVGETNHEQVATSLHHNHLLDLSEAGLIESCDGTTVALSSSIDPELVREVTRAGEGAWEALGALLSEERRERVVAMLSSADGSMSLSDLAGAVATIEDATTSGPREAVESARVTLHHVDLPKLADAGVVNYDAEDRRVELVTVPDAYRAYVADASARAA